MNKLLIPVLLLPLIVFSCVQSEYDQTKAEHNERNLIPEKFDTLSNVITHPVLDEAPYRVSLIKETEYGDSEDAYLSDYRSVGGLVLTNSFLRFVVDENGQVFIANNNQIEVFDAYGAHLKTLGRKGRGPGEFSNHGPLVPRITSNFVYAFDDGLSRINVYHADSLSFSHTFIVDTRKIVQSLDAAHPYISLHGDAEIYMVNDSLIFIGFKEPYQESVHGGFKRYIMLDQNGEVVSDSILYYKEHPNNSYVDLLIGTGKKPPYITMQMPTESYMKTSFDRDHNIYKTTGEDFFIKEYAQDGTYKRAIYHPYEHSSLNNEDIEAIIEHHGDNATREKRASDYDYPSHWPAIHEFFVDDEGRIWVATITDDNENYEWWILKNNGEIMAKFKRPGERIKRNYRNKSTPLPIVKNGYFYISETDDESELNVVAKYKIEFTER